MALLVNLWSTPSSVKLLYHHSRPNPLSRTFRGEISERHLPVSSLLRTRVGCFSSRCCLNLRSLSAASLGNFEGGTGDIHQVTFNEVPKTKGLQESFLTFIQENPGQKKDDPPALSACYGRLERTIVFSSDATGTEEQQQSKLTWPVEWSLIEAIKSQNLAIGSIPTSGEQMSAVLSQGGFDAVVVAMHPAEILALNIDIQEIGQTVTQSNKVLLQCPATDGEPGSFRDETGLGVVDVMQLKEALRAVTALIKTGQKTLVCCTCGTTVSALLALCYLTFVEGFSLMEGLAALRFSVPAAAPPLRSWDEARDTWSTLEDSTRLRRLAEEAAKGRAAANKPGSAMDDWVAARQQLIFELLNEQANADVALAKVVSRTSESESSQQSSGASVVNPSYQDFLKQSMVDAAAAAEQETGMLRQALAESSAESRRLAAELASAERQLADATMARRRAEKEEQQQPDAFNEIQAFLAQSALESALRQEQEAKEAIQALEADLRSSSRQQAAALERMDFLEREAVRLRQKEETSRKVAKEAVKQSQQMAAKLERTEAQRVAAAEKTQVLEAEVEALKEQNRKAEQTEAELMQLRQEAAALSSALQAAEGAAAAAKDKSEFLTRQVTALREKVEAGKRDQVIVQLVESANQASAEFIAELQAELQQAKEQARRAEAERDTALQEVSLLTVKLQEAEKKEQEATKKLLQAEHRITILLKQVDATRVKRSAAEGALVAAQQQVERMARSVGTMRQRLFQSASQSSGSGSAAALISTAESLYSKLEEQAKKLRASIAATNQTTTSLEQRQQANKSASKVQDPGLAKKAPAEMFSEADARLTREQEELLQEASCLREAVEFLEGAAKAVGSQSYDVNRAVPASAVGFFSDLIEQSPEEREKDALRVRRSQDPWRM